MKNKQVTCTCSAYSFPHRINSGKCNGSEWTEFYYYNYKTDCEFCNCNVNFECQVSTGQEDIKNCEAYNNFLHYDTGERFPIDFDNYYKET